LITRKACGSASDPPKGAAMNRKTVRISILALVCLIAVASDVWAKKPINTNWWGVAVKGYDVVAYRTLAKPVKGIKAFETEWQDAKWRFSSAEHLRLFKSNPEKYAPQYGGY
jgi:hypothetical protein